MLTIYSMYCNRFSLCCDADMSRPNYDSDDLYKGIWFCTECGKEFTIELNGYDEEYVKEVISNG